MTKHTHTRTRNPLWARRLDAYKVALQLCKTMQPHVDHIGKSYKDLADQLRRSLPSILNNLSEAMRRTGNDRAHLLTVSLGSADEVRSSIDAALISGLMHQDGAQHADDLADRYCAMVYRLRQRLG